MQAKLKKQILDSFVLIMRPAVRMLLRYGIGYREFMEVVKTAYVDIGSSDFGIRGRPTNISRVAVMTGLTRKEVKRIRENIAAGVDAISVKTTPLADVLHYWHTEEEFTDSSGRPRILPFLGEARSFQSLVKRFGGDIPAGAMRTEMKRVGALVENDDGTLTVTNRSYQPSENHDLLVTSLVHGVYPLLANTAYNTDPDRSGETWAHRVAYTQVVKSEEGGRLRRISKDRIVSFTESIDDIFMAYEALQVDTNRDDDVKNENTIAVGAFYFEELDKKANYQW